MIVILIRPVPDDAVQGVTLLYVAFLPSMPGALASAEEHQLGTIEWQMTLPMASWKQWIVKVGVVLGVAGFLALGLPGALGLLPDRVLLARLGVAVLMLAAGSLYVSSASHSSLWALLTAIFAMVVAAALAVRVALSLYPQPANLPSVGLRMFMSVAVAAWSPDARETQPPDRPRRWVASGPSGCGGRRLRGVHRAGADIDGLTAGGSVPWPLVTAIRFSGCAR